MEGGMTYTADASAETLNRDSRGCYGRMNKKPWSVYEIGAVLGGFALFWRSTRSWVWGADPAHRFCRRGGAGEAEACQH